MVPAFLKLNYMVDLSEVHRQDIPHECKDMSITTSGRGRSEQAFTRTRNHSPIRKRYVIPER